MPTSDTCLQQITLTFKLVTITVTTQPYRNVFPFHHSSLIVDWSIFILNFVPFSIVLVLLLQNEFSSLRLWARYISTCNVYNMNSSVLSLFRNSRHGQEFVNSDTTLMQKCLWLETLFMETYFITLNLRFWYILNEIIGRKRVAMLYQIYRYQHWILNFFVFPSWIINECFNTS